MSKSKKDTQSLIDDLCKDTAPVKHVGTLATRWIGWLITAAAIGFGGVLFFKVSPSLDADLHSGWYLLELFLLAMGWFWASGCLLRCSVPSEDTIKKQYWALTPCLLYLAIIVGYFVGHVVSQGGMSTIAMPQWHCIKIILAVGIIPLLLLAALVRQAAPLRLRYSGFLIALSGGLLGAFSLQFVCPVRAADHLMMSHAVPVVAIALLGYVVVSKWIKRL